VIFENFLKFSKRCCEVPLWPIRTIMVTAKLDHSRVLVTKFHQNRSMLKGRSASQRHTDRQTNSAENKGPSGLQSGQQSCRQTYQYSSQYFAIDPTGEVNVCVIHSLQSYFLDPSTQLKRSSSEMTKSRSLILLFCLLLEIDCYCKVLVLVIVSILMYIVH